MKEILTYIPYKVQMVYVVRGEVLKVGVLNNVSINYSDIHPIRYSINTLNELEHEWMFKPILRPLSDLTKEIEINGEKFIPTVWLRDNHFQFGIQLEDMKTLISMFIYTFKSPLSAPYYFIDKLLEWHFDVFGLIEKGLAVDINKQII